jgi:phage terminase large subunit-like protein
MSKETFRQRDPSEIAAMANKVISAIPKTGITRANPQTGKAKQPERAAETQTATPKKGGLLKQTTIQKTALKLFKSKAREYLLVGGSRSGKTFIIIYQQLQMAVKYPGSRHLIARYRFNHAKNSVWLDTLRKVVKLAAPDIKITRRNADYYLDLENGSQIWLAGLDDKDRTEKILGMEFLTVFLNEASQISYGAYTTIKTRLAQRISGAQPLLFVDANPPGKKHWLYQVFIRHIDPETNTGLIPGRYASLKMNPDQNQANISKDYLQTLDSLPLRKRIRFRDGEFADETEGALWTDDLINSLRILRPDDGTLPVSLKRIVVAIDPAVTSKDTSDETGIIVAGIGFNDHLYVIEDKTDYYKPAEWARQAVALYQHYRADRIIGEVNNGGDLIETVLRNVNSKISYKSVHATRDKLTRAEPVAAMYEQGKAHHIGQLLELELEMTSWEAKKAERSPNRIDALVWAATELCLTGTASLGRARFNFRKKENNPVIMRKWLLNMPER